MVKTMYNKRMILDHIIAIMLMGYTLYNIFTVDIFTGIQSIIMVLAIVYSVYCYMVYRDITKN